MSRSRLTDRQLMTQLLALARPYRGHTRPNPPVAAAVVNAGKILSTGVHVKAGDDHAEVSALKATGSAAAGADLYVTLQPCSHQGRTPPCTTAIINARIKRVVYGATDPNPKVKDRSDQILLQAGIQVESGLLAPKAGKLLDVYRVNMTKNRPFVTVKLAMTLDGKIALRNGNSMYLTGKKARQDVHRIRSEVDAVVIGRQTVAIDNPRLSVRHGQQHHHPSGPKKIILGLPNSFNETYAVFENTDPTNIILVTNGLSEVPVQTVGHWTIPSRGNVFWETFLTTCWDHGIYHVMIEGGQAIFSSCIQSGVADQIIAYIAPKIIGDSQAISGIEGRTVTEMSDLLNLVHPEIKSLSPDVRLSGYTWDILKEA